VPESKRTIRRRLYIPEWILAFLATVAVGLAVHDAVLASALASRGSAPEFLFLLVPPNLMSSASRFVSLALQLALPALALFLPLVTFAAGVRLRGRHLVSRSLVAAGGGLLVLGIVADFALYRTLVARPQEAAEATAQGRTERPEEPEGTPPPARPGVEKIVFASDRRDSKWDLWIMDPDGSGQERLSKTDRMHMQPRFSPDGTRVTFTSTGEGGKHLVMLLDPVTRAEREVCEGDQSSFTGDGKGLVFRRGGKIWNRDLASGEEKLVSPRMWSKCSFPSASPDGARVALASRLLAGYNIYVVPLGGEAAEPTTLVSGKGTCDPRWSPTGRWLSYQTETHVFMIRPDGSEKYQVTIGGGVQHYATWSPDEKAMAYCQGPGPNGPWQIWRVSLEEDEDPVRLTREGSNIYPDWGRVPAAP